MAKGAYDCIDGLSRNGKKIPLCVDGVSRNAKEGWGCIDGVSRQFFPSSIAMSSLSVGDSVFMNVNGVRTEFLIVHIGCPTSAGGTYTNAYGMWVLMKDIYTKRRWHSSDYTKYADSEIHDYLNTTFLNLLDEGVASQILQAGIPCTNDDTWSTGELSTVTAKVFLPSLYELYAQVSYVKQEGGPLNYFQYSTGSGLTDVKQRRYAYYDGTITDWWTRTHEYNGYGVSCIRGADAVNVPGSSIQIQSTGTTIGVRPAMIFPYDTALDENFNIIA